MSEVPRGVVRKSYDFRYHEVGARLLRLRLGLVRVFKREHHPARGIFAGKLRALHRHIYDKWLGASSQAVLGGSYAHLGILS